MSVTAEPKVLNFREYLEEAQVLRQKANSNEEQIRADLEKLLYHKIMMQPIVNDRTQREVERFGGFDGSVQLRKFGETGGWSMAHRQLRAVPATGLMVGFEVNGGEAHLILASTLQRYEWRFNLRHFTAQLFEKD